MVLSKGEARRRHELQESEEGEQEEEPQEGEEEGEEVDEEAEREAEARRERQRLAREQRDQFAKDCEEGNLAGVRQYRGDVDAFVSFDYRFSATGLYVAARKGNIAVCRALVNEMGADVDKASEDVESKTNPLRAAAGSDNLELVRVFVEELGADLHLTIPLSEDEEAEHPWPMKEVIYYADPGPTLQYLVRKGVDPNTADVGERFGKEDLKSPLIARFSCSAEYEEPENLLELRAAIGECGRSCWVEGVEYDYCAPITLGEDSTCADWLWERGFELIDNDQATDFLGETAEIVDLQELSSPAFLNYCELYERTD